MGNLAFAESHEAAPLQAADLLAYELHRYHKKWRSGAGDSNMRMEGYRAMARMKTIQDFWLFDKTRMTNLHRAMEATVKGALGKA